MVTVCLVVMFHVLVVAVVLVYFNVFCWRHLLVWFFRQQFGAFYYVSYLVCFAVCCSTACVVCVISRLVIAS